MATPSNAKALSPNAKALSQLRKPLDLHSMSRRAARVEIAKDVIAALKIDAIQVAWAHGYCEIILKNERRFEEDENENGPELRDYLDPNQSSCTACALGAMLLAEVARCDAFGAPGYVRSMVVDGLEVSTRLRSYFSLHMLALMEAAFEFGNLWNDVVYGPPETAACDYRLTDKEALKVMRFAEKTYNPKDRILAIMRNVVANDGDFVI